MKKIIHFFRVHAAPEEVYRALTTDEGLAGWWSTSVRLESEVGGIIHFHFAGDFNPEMKVTRLDSNRKVEWQCVAGHDNWQDNTFAFDLREANTETDVMFVQLYEHYIGFCVCLAQVKRESVVLPIVVSGDTLPLHLSIRVQPGYFHLRVEIAGEMKVNDSTHFRLEAHRGAPPTRQTFVSGERAIDFFGRSMDAEKMNNLLHDSKTSDRYYSQRRLIFAAINSFE